MYLRQDLPELACLSFTRTAKVCLYTFMNADDVGMQMRTFCGLAHKEVYRVQALVHNAT